MANPTSINNAPHNQQLILHPTQSHAAKSQVQTRAPGRANRDEGAKFEGRLPGRAASPGGSSAPRQAAALLSIGGQVLSGMPGQARAVGMAMGAGGQLLNHFAQSKSAGQPPALPPQAKVQAAQVPTGAPTPTSPSIDHLLDMAGKTASDQATQMQYQSTVDQARLAATTAQAATVNQATSSKLQAVMATITAAQEGIKSVNKIAISGAKAASEMVS